MHTRQSIFLDAKDYASNGELRVYSTSGDLLETVPAGVILPGHLLSFYGTEFGFCSISHSAKQCCEISSGA